MNMLILLELSLFTDAFDDVLTRPAGLPPLAPGCGEPDAGSLAVAGGAGR